VACRFGGDEFVVALPGKDIPEATEMAETLRKSVRIAAPTLAGISFPPGTLSISIGLACGRCSDEPRAEDGRADSELGESLFRAADRALYLAKDAGRNRVSCDLDERNVMAEIAARNESDR
jgi:diguanylate cyclase (GGDEF)-like protein